MNRTGMFIKKYKDERSFWITLYVFTHIILVLYLVNSNNIALHGNDEFFFNSFLGGMYGKYIPYDMFENIIFTHIVSYMYRMAPVCNWLILIYLTATFFSYNVYAYLFICRIRKGSVAFFISVLILLLSYTFVYKHLNFTQVAGMAVLAGILLVMHVIRECEKGYIPFICGSILICLGFMIRQDAAAQSMIYVAIFFYEFLRGKIAKPDKKKMLMCASLAVVLLVIFGVNKVYYMSPEWKYTIEKNKLRAVINDYSDMRFVPEDSIDWEQVGMNREDYDFFMNWFPADKNVYTIDSLKRLVEYDSSLRGWTRIVKWIIEGLMSYLFIVILNGSLDIFTLASFSAFCILMVFLSIRSRRIEMVLLYMITNFQICYCMILNRIVARAVLIPLMCAVVISVYYFAESDIPDRFFDAAGSVYTKNKAVMIVVYIWLGIYVIFSGVIVCNQKKVISYTDPEIFKTFKGAIDTTDSKDLFILHYDNYLRGSYSLLDCPEYGIYSDCIFDAGWHSALPYTYEKLGEYGNAESPYEVMLDNDHVYILDDHCLEDRLDFIRRHYENGVDIGLVHFCDELSAYSITKKLKADTENDIVNWNIEKSYIRKGRDGYDFIVLSGNIEGSSDDASYFMELQNGTKSFFYEIRVDNGNYHFGVPVKTWFDTGECKAYLYEKEDYCIIKDNDDQVIDLGAIFDHIEN